MNAEATLHPLPLVFSMAPTGTLCSGTAITLNGSQPGITYHLIRNNLVNNPQSLQGTGDPLDFGPQFLAGDYAITAFDAYGCQSPMNGTATLVPRPVAFQVTPQGSLCAPASVGLDDSETGVTYHLLRNGNPTQPPQSTAGTGSPISFGTQPDGTYTIRAITDASGCDKMMNGQALINPAPLAMAGPDGQICQNTAFSPTASAQNYTSLLWTSSGDGTFDMPNALIPAYTPGPNDIASGSAMLFLKAFAGPACPGTFDADTLLLSIHPLPIIEAGNNTTLCSNQTFQASASASNFLTLYWTTSGDGTFSDNTLTNPVYTPGTDDISNGGATLVLLASATDACAGNFLSDSLTLTILAPPAANAGNNASICSGETYLMQGSGSGYASILWTTSGNGLFSNPFILNPVYTPSPDDQAAGSVVLTLTLSGSPGCPANSTADDMTLSIPPLPSVFAGAAAATCHNTPYSLSASASNYSALLWNTSGDGAFSATNILSPNYTPGPGDIANGSVLLSLQAWGTAGCTPYSVTDPMTLTIQPLPSGTAGPDATICANNAFSPLANASDYSSVIWTTSGNGIFNNPSLLNPSYTPGSSDIAAGSVTLTVNIYGNEQCTGYFISDELSLSINPLPMVNAGPDATLCANSSHLLQGSASGYASLMWISPGDGTFSNPTLLNPVYTPGPNDIANGCVTLSLRAYGTLTCSGSYAQDNLSLCFQPLPLADAGPDMLICATSPAPLNGSALYQSSVMWTSSGDGVFANPSALVTSYSPGPNDIADGYAILTLTAFGSVQCNAQSHADELTLSVQPLPSASAGPPQTICANASATLYATAANYSTLSWATAGDGTFSNPTPLSIDYSPGPFDIANGSAVITLFAYGIAPCNNAAASSITLITINPLQIGRASCRERV